MTAEIAWPLFALASLMLALTPGPDMIYVVSRGLAQGPRAGVLSALGLVIGLSAHVVLAALGTSALLRASPLAFDILQAAGAAYLLWMGWQLWRATPALGAHGGGRVLPTRALLRQGALSALLNPKLALFFLAFLPQFVPAGSARPMADALVLGLAFSAIGFVVMALAGVMAGQLNAWAARRPAGLRWVFRASALLMLGLGLRLLLNL